MIARQAAEYLDEERPGTRGVPVINQLTDAVMLIDRCWRVLGVVREPYYPPRTQTHVPV